jgi:hypothetical protein
MPREEQSEHVAHNFEHNGRSPVKLECFQQFNHGITCCRVGLTSGHLNQMQGDFPRETRSVVVRTSATRLQYAADMKQKTHLHSDDRDKVVLFSLDAHIDDVFSNGGGRP